MIPIVELIRLEENFQYGTFGVIKINKQVFSDCMRYSSVRHPDTFQVMNVPDRDLILWHPGNLIEHTEGCILLAQYYGKLRGNRAVLNSGLTFKSFINIMIGVNEFHLTIKEYY